MSNPYRFRFHKNGPEASASYNERWTSGCYGCQENRTMKNMPSVHYCMKSVKGFPNETRESCKHWRKK